MARQRVVAILLSSVLVTASCGSFNAGPAPSAQGSPVPSPRTEPPAGPVATGTTASPESAATPTSHSTAAPWATEHDRPKVDAFAVVVTNDLRVRSKPGVGADSKKLRPLLNAGTDVYVAAGPFPASGYEWYEVYAPYDPAGDRPEVFGWVAAAGTDGEPWIRASRSPCPDRPEGVADLAALPWGVGLACFSGRRLTVAAWLGTYETCGGFAEGWTIEPRWLGDTCAGNHGMWIADRMVEGEDDFEWTLPVTAVFDPKLDTSGFHPGNARAAWIPVKVTGIFDHPAATACRGVSEGDRVPITDDQAILQCRAEFVITAMARKR